MRTPIPDNSDIIEEWVIDQISRASDFITSKNKKMNTLSNVSLSVLATGLIALGVETIKTDVKMGVIQIGLGIVLYCIYEYFPTKSV